MTVHAARADIHDVEQLALVDVPPVPKVTDRQQRALDLITDAGYDGLSSDELGAHFHRHDSESRCMYCGSTGLELGRALRTKNLVQQRRRTAPGGDLYMVWTITGKLDAPRPAPVHDDIPY